MEKFIQRVLSCVDIRKTENLIAAFPIIRVQDQYQNRDLLIFRFQKNAIPNYLVIGAFKEDTLIERKTFLEWLKNLNDLIFLNPMESKNEYHNIFNKVKNSIYFNQLLYTQEGFDLLNGKEHFTSTGLISRTVEVECLILPDRTIEFYQMIHFHENNQFLDGDFFQEYEEYERKYFLNYDEYHTMSYLNVLTYLKLNAQRILGIVSVSSYVDEDWIDANIGYLVQILDSYLTNPKSQINPSR